MCVFARPLTPEDVAKLHAIRDLEIQQKTPVRVLHRRAALTRPRLINWRVAVGGACGETLSIFPRRVLRTRGNDD